MNEPIKIHYLTDRELIGIRKRLRRQVARTTWIYVSGIVWTGSAQQGHVGVHRHIKKECDYILWGERNENIR